jgi:hypothetical protein
MDCFEKDNFPLSDCRMRAWVAMPNRVHGVVERDIYVASTDESARAFKVSLCRLGRGRSGASTL